MDVFLVRVFLFTLLPVLVALLLIRLDERVEDQYDRTELYLIYFFGLGVAGSGIGGFFGHIFLSDVVAESVGWASGSPFQLEMGFANLALGVLGIMATNRTGGFRTATVIAVTIIGVGATLVHFYDILLTGNLAPGNTIQNAANLIRPGLLILFLRQQQKTVGRVSKLDHGQAWHAWKSAHAKAAGWLTAIVAAGFGMGFAFDMPALGSFIGVVIGILAVWRQLQAEQLI
jgi:hypothetical protein